MSCKKETKKTKETYKKERNKYFKGDLHLSITNQNHEDHKFLGHLFFIDFSLFSFPFPLFLLLLHFLKQNIGHLTCNAPASYVLLSLAGSIHLTELCSKQLNEICGSMPQ